MPEVGTEFAGYRLEEVVGRGGMSIVYRAQHLRLERTVALNRIWERCLLLKHLGMQRKPVFKRTEGLVSRKSSI